MLKKLDFVKFEHATFCALKWNKSHRESLYFMYLYKFYYIKKPARQNAICIGKIQIVPIKGVATSNY